MSETIYLEGMISVMAAIEGGQRAVTAVYIRRNKWGRATRRLRQLAKKHNVSTERVDAEFITQRVTGNSHGGVIAHVQARSFVGLGDLLSTAHSPFVVMLDGIEDPFNFGQAIRALYSAGVDGIVVRPRNWSTAVSIVARASAGASERVQMAVAETAVDAATFYKQHGLTIACTDTDQAQTIYTANLQHPIFLLIGGEKRGITRSFLDLADMTLTIPYARPFPYSLGAAASAAIIGFEVARQRERARTA